MTPFVPDRGTAACWVFTLALSLNVLESTAQLPHPLDLAQVGVGLVEGVRFEGINIDDKSGEVSGAGDVNGDGFADFLIAAWDADPQGRSRAGEVYLIYGSASVIAPGGVLSLDDLDGQNGVRILGAATDETTGTGISGAGDVNGDGFADLLIGADEAGGITDPGRTYVIYGSPMGIGSGGVLDLATFGPADGDILEGTDLDDGTGIDVSGAGDVNGDGFDDLLIGAFVGNLAEPGEAYLIYGSASGIGSGGFLALASLNGINGVRFDGIDPGDHCGRNVSGAGDVNSDGLADLLIGAAASTGEGVPGEAYVILGSTSEIGSAGAFPLSTLNGTNGVRLDGIDVDDLCGWIVAGAGDANGDGIADILVGARFADPGGNSDAGEAYLVYGSASGIGIGGTLALATLNGSNGVRFDGIGPDTRAGTSGGAGDFNGDGFSDLLVGSPDFSASPTPGEAHLVYGSSSEIGNAGVLSLSAVNGINGIRLDGVDPNDRAGLNAGVGDVNGDGISDMVIGARFGDPQGVTDAGESYLVFGSGTSNSATHRAFTRAGDAPRTGIGTIGGESHFIPMSRVWVDYSMGDDGTGSASSTEVIFHRDPVSSFTPLRVSPEYEWEISTSRVGYGSAAVTFKGFGVAGETDWSGRILASDDGGTTWLAPPQSRDSLLHEITVPGQVLPRRYAMIVASGLATPELTDAVFQDSDDSGTADPGEVLTLVFDRGVLANPGLLSEASFILPVGGDSLGTGVTVASNPFSSRLVDVTLGAGVSLTITGDFGVGASSGIALDPALDPAALQSLSGVPAKSFAPVDILYQIVSGPPTVVGAAGGVVSVASDPNAAYTRHRLSIPSGALASPETFTMEPPPDGVSILSAVNIDATDPNVAFGVPATLTLEYRESDVDRELGQIEAAMLIHQMVETSPGVFTPVPLTTPQTVNVLNNTVTATLFSLNPQGSTGTARPMATLPIEPVAERTIHIKPTGSGGGASSGPSLPMLTPGTDSFYTEHRVEFPGYEMTTAGAASSFAVTIRTATIFDRVSVVGGNSFPDQSGALFVIETRDENGNSVAFPDPVNIRVEFKPTDQRNFEGLGGLAEEMQLVKDRIDGPQIDFGTATGTSQTINMSTPLTIDVTGVAGLTGASGQGTWGTVLSELAPTAAQSWELYR